MQLLNLSTLGCFFAFHSRARDSEQPVVPIYLSVVCLQNKGLTLAIPQNSLYRAPFYKQNDPNGLKARTHKNKPFYRGLQLYFHQAHLGRGGVLSMWPGGLGS